MPHIRLAAALFAALSLAACDGLFEPGERPQEQLVFRRFVKADRISALDSTDLYLVNADGTGLRNLTNHPALYGTPSLSPDGRSVLFDSNQGGSLNHVWVMNTDGTGLRQLVSENSGGARWSPDGTRIAMLMAPGNDGVHVWVMNADGSNRVKVSGPAMQVGTPCGGTATSIGLVGWLPDGRLGFSRHYCGFGYRFFTVNADGSGFAQTEIDLYQAAWSPDGSRVVFSAYEGSTRRVFVMNADGTGRRMLTTHGTDQYLPLQYGRNTPWSPDGERIMFYANAPGGTGICDSPALPYVIDADGTGLQLLMDVCTPTFNGWSPSGNRVALTSLHDTGVYDVYVVNDDGSGSRNVTRSPLWEFDAQWVPRR